jgi:hypothetical protein
MSMPPSRVLFELAAMTSVSGVSLLAYSASSLLAVRKLADVG